MIVWLALAYVRKDVNLSGFTWALGRLHFSKHTMVVLRANKLGYESKNVKLLPRIFLQ